MSSAAVLVTTPGRSPSFDGWFRGDRAGRENDPSRCNFFNPAGSQIDRERVRPCQSSLAKYQLDSPGSQQLLDTANQLIDDGLPVAHQAGQIHGCVRDGQPKLTGALGLNQQFHRGCQSLRRDATDIQAGAADCVFLDENHARTTPGRRQCRHIAAWPPAKHCQIDWLTHHQ